MHVKMTFLEYQKETQILTLSAILKMLRNLQIYTSNITIVNKQEIDQIFRLAMENNKGLSFETFLLFIANIAILGFSRPPFNIEKTACLKYMYEKYMKVATKSTKKRETTTATTLTATTDQIIGKGKNVELLKPVKKLSGKMLISKKMEAKFLRNVSS